VIQISIFQNYIFNLQEIRSVEHSICPIAEFTVHDWTVRIVTEYRLRYGDFWFWFFKMAAKAILDFWNFKFLTVGTLKGVELHHRAKFHQNRSNSGRHMAIFRFFKTAAAATLDFEISNFWRSKRSRGSNCIRMPNIVKIARTAAKI